jgi:AhpD family alkylhydroperoxidase
MCCGCSVIVKQIINKEVSIMESQLEIREGLLKERAKFEQAIPDVMSTMGAFYNEAYKDGALSSKVKRLIALGIALSNACTGCILAQTIRAIETGATKDEVLEACVVAMSIGGTIASAESLRVVKLLDELGKL